MSGCQWGFLKGIVNGLTILLGMFIIEVPYIIQLDKVWIYGILWRNGALFKIGVPTGETIENGGHFYVYQ